MIYEITDTRLVSALFCGWEETLIWSCLQGVMGKIYGDDPDHPTAAMAINGDFIFLAGVPNAELTAYKPDWCTKNFMIMVPQNKGWQDMITRIYGPRAKVISRYAFKKEPDIFDREMLAKAASSLPEPYHLSMIDERLYHLCRQEAWSADLVSQFPDYEAFCRLGIGVVACRDQVPVSGASTYSRYLGGIEIEIDTREEYRRKGLAYACGARLILECFKRDLYPSWDAHNKGSAALAKKLGYHFSHEYTAVEVWRY